MELIDGHKLAGAMSDANIARTENNRFSSQRDHRRRLSAKGHCARRVAGRMFKELNDC